jgi:hypothetical protein
MRDAAEVPEDLGHPNALEPPDVSGMRDASEVPEDLGHPNALEPPDVSGMRDAWEVPEDLGRPTVLELPDVSPPLKADAGRFSALRKICGLSPSPSIGMSAALLERAISARVTGSHGT